MSENNLILTLNDRSILERIVAEIRLVEDRWIQIYPLEVAVYRQDRIVQLNLSVHNLSYLPNAITDLTALESLFIGFNNLQRLPKDIGKLRELKYLAVWNNQLTSLPDSIGELNKLLILDLGYNKIKVLPDTIHWLFNLRRLNLENNSLKNIPLSVLKLGNLEVLHIYLNPIDFKDQETINIINQLQSKGVKVHTHLRKSKYF